MFVILMTVLAGLSVLCALFRYFSSMNSSEELFAQRTESIIFLLLAVFFILVAMLFKQI